jgi:methionine synthase II (cobalamin-independent)/2-polyprenyl-6-methoxyphenol hydroxylase-like FAD-dependent oxidoreductase
MDRGASEDVPVLIVGGSLVGLSAALFLRWHGVDALVVERHAGTAINARAGHFHLRTVEILRSAGLEDAVRHKSQEQYPLDGGINNVESLAGREIANYFPNLNAGVEEFSPTVRLFINQDALEPILRTRAAELGARLRYRTECTSLEQDADGITAVVRDLERGTESSVRAKYVVAADGNRSPVRERLGIGMHGHGLLSHSITIYFRALADLGPLLKGRNQGVHYVTNPVMRGFFRLDRSGNAGFLVVNLVGDTSRPEVIAAFPCAPWANVAEGITEQRALELLRAAIGVPDIGVVIDNIATWRAEANCADRFGDGRVFLAGDAAHVVPPNGGYGGNTGVQDAHNLAWKLALTLAGVAGPGLLDTYDAERRPVGDLTVEQAFTRYVTRVAPYLGTENTRPMVDDFSMEIGYRYDSPAVVLEPGSPPLHEHPRESAGRPGARAPHVFLDRDGTRLSTLDLFGRNFVLLAGSEGAAWPAAALAVAWASTRTWWGEPGWPTRRAASPGRTGSRRPEPYWCDRTASWAGGPLKRPAHPNRLSGRRSRRCCAGETAGHELRVQKAKEGPLMAHVYRADTVGSLLRPQYLKLAREQFEAGQLAAAAYKEIEDRAVDQAIVMQEAVGLDVVTDGELRRHTFIDQLTEQVEGLTLDPGDGDSDHVPVPFHDESGALKSVFTIPLSITSKLGRRRMMTVEEYSYARARARRPVKVTLPSPLMLFLVWSPRRSRDAYRDPFELFADGLRLMREEAEELARLGCRYIQVDAPDFGQLVDQTQRDAWERAGISVDRVFSEGADMLNEVAGIPGVTFGLHLCRGNYDSDWISSGAYETISKQLFRRAANYDILLLEYDDERSGSFSALSDVPDDKVVVLGMVSSKLGTMEPADQLAARIREASSFFPREQLALSTQCGFASAGPGNAISEDDQENKLRLVAEVANRVWPTAG